MFFDCVPSWTSSGKGCGFSLLFFRDRVRYWAYHWFLKIFSGAVHAMDCTDIVIGAARGSLSRIGDYYTRDRSTPMRDEFYNGVQSLTASIGKEENGYTTILFRRKLEGI